MTSLCPIRRDWKHKKVYFGDWPMFAGENAKDYLKRLHSWAGQGCLIPALGRCIGKDEDYLFNSSDEAAEYWYSL